MNESDKSTPGTGAQGRAESSVASRMFNVIAAPGDVFGEVRSSPSRTSNWLVPAVVVALVGLIGFWIAFTQPSIQQQISEIIDKAIEKQGQAAQMNEQAREMGRKIGGFFMKLSISAEPVVTGFVMPFWWGLIIWVVGAKVFKGDFGFMKAVEVAGLTNAITIIEYIVRILMTIGLGNIFAGAHLGLLVDEFDTANTVHMALASLNLFSFWALIVRALGMAKLSGASFVKSLATLFILYVVFNGGMIGFSILMQRLGGG